MLCLVAFVSVFVLGDARAVVSAQIAVGPTTDAPARFSRLDVETFTLPPHLGSVKFSGKGSSDRIVIHIQDAHADYYAQQKISGIIDYLNKEYGIRMVNLEGGTGDYDLAIFTSISGDAIRREVADYFVKTGEINGAEFYAINNPDRVVLWGVENKELYLANLKVYRDSLKYKTEVDGYLAELTHVLDNLKRHIYTPELLRMDNAYNSYKSAGMDFREYLEFLIKEAKDSAVLIRNYPNIYLLSQAMALEDKVDFKKANMERNTLVDELKKQLSQKELRELVEKSVNFKTKKISRKVFYDYLLKKAGELNLDVARFPALSNYIVYVTIYESVDRGRVMGELDSFEAAIKEPMYRNATQRQLNTLSRHLALMKNIFEISLTKSDYKYYLTDESAFDVNGFTQFIAREAPKYKIDVPLSPNISILDDYRGDIIKFYEYSFKRDDAFMKNIRFTSTPGGSEDAILMTGGFHTENLCEKLNAEGISYVSIMPKFIDEKGYENPYFDLLAGQTADVQRMLSSALAKASTMQIASMLTTLGEAVWGAANISAFDARVYIRDRLVRDSALRIAIVNNDGTTINMPDGEPMIFGEGNAEPETMTLTALQDAVRQRKIAAQAEQAKKQAAAEIGPEGTFGLMGNMQLPDGTVLTSGFKIKDADGSDFIEVTHERLDTPMRIYKAGDGKLDMTGAQAMGLMRGLLLDETGNPKWLGTLTYNEREKIRVLANLMGGVSKIVIINNNRDFLGIHGSTKDGNRIIYINKGLLFDKNFKFNPLTFLHELGEGFVELPGEEEYSALTRHTYMRGAGKDARAAYDFLAKDMTPETLNTPTAEEFTDNLEKKMQELKMRSLTDSEKALIEYNFTQQAERAGVIDMGAQGLLFGLQDNLDPNLNIVFTQEIRGIIDELRRDSLNFILIPAINLETASAQATLGTETARKFRRAGVDTRVSHYSLDLEDQLKKIIDEASMDINRGFFPEIFVYCLTDADRNVAERYRRQYPGMLAIGNDVPEYMNAEDIQIEEVKVIAVASAILNDKRMSEDFDLTAADLAGRRREMLESFTMMGLIDIELNLAGMTPEGLADVMRAIYNGEILLKITRVNWQEVKDGIDAQEQVLRAL